MSELVVGFTAASCFCSQEKLALQRKAVELEDELKVRLSNRLNLASADSTFIEASQ